jgi:hypothetical protein
MLMPTDLSLTIATPAIVPPMLSVPLQITWDFAPKAITSNLTQALYHLSRLKHHPPPLTVSSN